MILFLVERIPSLISLNLLSIYGFLFRKFRHKEITFYRNVSFESNHYYYLFLLFYCYFYLNHLRQHKSKLYAYLTNLLHILLLIVQSFLFNFLEKIISLKLMSVFTEKLFLRLFISIFVGVLFIISLNIFILTQKTSSIFAKANCQNFSDKMIPLYFIFSEKYSSCYYFFHNHLIISLNEFLLMLLIK